MNWGNGLIQPPNPIPEPLNPHIRTMPKASHSETAVGSRRRWHREGAVMWCVQQLRLGLVDESFPCQNTLPKCSAFNASSLHALVNTFDFGRDVNLALDERGCPGRRCLLFYRCSVKLLAPPPHNLSLGEGGGRVTPLRQTMGLRQRGCGDDPCLLGHTLKGFCFVFSETEIYLKKSAQLEKRKRASGSLDKQKRTKAQLLWLKGEWHSLMGGKKDAFILLNGIMLKQRRHKGHSSVWKRTMQPPFALALKGLSQNKIEDCLKINFLPPDNCLPLF